jgi:hypothetical protein
VVQPDRATALGCGHDRRVGPQGHQFRAFVVGQPDLDVFFMGGQPSEADSAHGAPLDLTPASGEIHPHDVAGRRLCLTREMTVDEQVHRAVRAGWL